MVSEEHDKTTEHEQVDALIDDLIRDILSEASSSTKTRARSGDPITTLIETALTSPRAATGASMIERLLVTRVLADALADALAPALADALAPEIMKALDQHTTTTKGGQSDKRAASPTRTTQSRGGRRKAT
ncbi:hypothetical protein [Streptosporangium sp. NPDC003464]